jgi:hypothetical protein
MDVRFPHSPAEVAKVELVQFGVLSPDEIVIPLVHSPPLCLNLVFEFEWAGWFVGIGG